MELYKKIGNKAKRAYQNWSNEQKPPYEPLDDESESSTEKRWDSNPWASRETTPNDDARESQASSEGTEAFYAEIEKENQSKKKDEASFVAGYMAAAKRIEKEAKDGQEEKQKLGNQISELGEANSNACVLQSSGIQDLNKERQRRDEGAKRGAGGQGRLEQKLGVSFAPIMPCSTPKTYSQVNPASGKHNMEPNTQEREAFYVHREDQPLLQAEDVYVDMSE